MTFHRQMNMDYSACQALSQNMAVKKAVCIYDIACSWSINLDERIAASPYLQTTEDLDIIPAVGKFHLGAHIQECFPLFSLNFVKGSGQVDGEVLETLWSNLNKVAGQTRGMSEAHRQEVLDDNMNDSNWKKLVKSGEYTFHLKTYNMAL
jgi:hypothetical protein